MSDNEYSGYKVLVVGNGLAGHNAKIDIQGMQNINPDDKVVVILNTDIIDTKEQLSIDLNSMIEEISNSTEYFISNKKHTKPYYHKKNFYD